MSFAALSTVIAVFENLISFSMDKWGVVAQARGGASTACS